MGGKDGRQKAVGAPVRLTASPMLGVEQGCETARFSQVCRPIATRKLSHIDARRRYVDAGREITVLGLGRVRGRRHEAN